ncbi:MAG: tetratricopeptide repeat protein [Elusimicrobiota bacterium]|jgi:tetratricopeptide (TPR) repeat protein|nr:tetratricopeptide repeat protein [Elusimicrobiota bacterium]
MKKYLIIFSACLFLLYGCESKSDGMFKKAVRFYVAGNQDSALKTYHAILRADPDYFPALVNRAVIYEKLGDFKNAENDYEHAYKIDPRNPQLLNNMGAFYASHRRPLMGIYYLNQAIDANPDYFEAYVNRAAAYESIDMVREAVEDIETAVILRPQSMAALEIRAVINMKRLYMTEALDDLYLLLSLDPSNAKNYYRRAIAFKQMQRYANAMQDLNSAIFLNPDYVDALYARAQLHFKNVDHNSAYSDVEKIKKISNNYAPAYELAGDIWAIEDPVQAVANYIAARKLDPANARRYNAKIALMRTEEGRKRVITRTFWEN